MGQPYKNGNVIEILSPRDVPLGGLRAMNVRRTLPARSRSLIGAWCFLDHYGPDDIDATEGMRVSPHPHTGLQTVSWLFTGEIEHKDSAGNTALVLPGEVNLMTAGRGISHSENSTGTVPVLHGAQLWVALPEHARATTPGFAHHEPAPIVGTGWEARVFLGSLLGDTSPVETFTPLLGAEIVLEAGAVLAIPVDPSYEHGILVDAGSLVLRTDEPGLTPVVQNELAYVPVGSSTLTIEAGNEWTRVLLLGGPPFGESIVMWWNFVGRTHDEIVAFREEWQRQITSADGSIVNGQDVKEGQFGIVVDDFDQAIPAPELPPGIKLKLRS